MSELIELTEEQLEKLVNHLRGSTNSLESGVAAALELDDLDGKNADEIITQSSLERIDEEIFLCQGCDWWCGNDEYGQEDDLCEQCSPEPGDDDE